MRVLVLLCVWLGGCVSETNYYGALGVDGGVNDMGYHDEFGDWHDDAPGDDPFEGQKGRVISLPPVLNNMNNLYFANNVGEEFINIRSARPRPVSIVFGISAVGNNPNWISTNAALYAYIEWGANGAMCAVAVDISAGMALTFFANSLTVRAFQMMQIGAAFPPAVSVNSQVSIFMAPVALIRRNKATLTVSEVTGAMMDAVLPRFAEKARVFSFPNNAQMLFDLYTVAGALNPLQRSNVVATATGDLPIPNGTAHWQLTNPGPVVPTNVSVQFDLAF